MKTFSRKKTKIKDSVNCYYRCLLHSWTLTSPAVERKRYATQPISVATFPFLMMLLEFSGTQKRFVL